MSWVEAVLQPFLDPASRTWWPGLVVTVAFCLILAGRAGLRQLVLSLGTHSSRLDIQLLLARQFLGLLAPITATAGGFWLASRVAIGLGGLGHPEVELAPGLVVALYTLLLFVAWDASRYALHRLMHAVPSLWSLHQVHHSAEHLTPLSFHRIHPLESLLYQLRGVLVTGLVTGAFFWAFGTAAVQWSLLGVHGIGLLLNTAFGNLRHSHVWLSFGGLEQWLVSPAQHQLHHSADWAQQHSNFGTWLAIWDRLGGTLVLADVPPERFGVDVRNHEDDLLSAWFGPLREIARSWSGSPALGQAPPMRGWLPLFGLLLLAGMARADEPGSDAPEADDDSEDDEAWEDGDPEGGDIIVYGEGGLPHVAGAANAIDEVELQRFEYDDIQRVLPSVPGVYVRGEDGFGLRPNIGMRGANSDRSAKITLLEDGIPLAPAPYAAPAAYYFPMTTRLTGVEVFKGPAATQHGPHTVGGAINLQTREVPTERAGGLDLAWGMRDSGKAHLWAGIGNDRRGLLAEGVHLSSGGFKRLDGGGPTGFRRSELMLKGRLATAPTADTHNELQLKLGFATESSLETYLGLHTGDYAADPYRRYAASQNALMQWNRTQAELGWHWARGPLTLHTVAYHHYLDRSWTKLNRFADGPDLHALLQGPDTGQSSVFLAILRGEEDSTTPGSQLMIGTNARRFQSFGVQTRGRLESDWGELENALEFGARLHGDIVDRVHTEVAHDMVDGALVDTGTDALTTLDSNASATALAVHLHDQVGYGPINVLPGVRFEGVRTQRVDNGGDKLDPQLRLTPLPGLAVLFEASDSLDLFVGSHRGFSPVAPGASADTRPELSWNHEVGMRLGNRTDNVELIGFANDYVNLTGQCTISGGCVGDQLDQQFNAGRAWVQGIELGMNHEALLFGRIWLPLSASGTFTDTRFRNDFVSGFPQFGTVRKGDFLPYVPRLQGSGRVAFESLERKVALSIGATGRSGMLDAAGTLPGDETDIPPLVLLDASLQAAVTDSVRLYATGTNLTGSTVIESWRPFGARPTAPLQVMVGVKAE